VQLGGVTAPFAQDYAAWTDAQPQTEPDVDGADDDLLFIMYTSGTTGLPKGVMHSHRTVLWSAMNVTASADFHYKDRYLTALPLFHVGALMPSLCCVYVGCTQVILKAFDPQAAWALIRDEKITTTLLVPTMRRSV
jgi:acyl-CoA synthetase (AMP-forming)/AMP-acid ligase II